jgi:hypothetical protein
MGDSDGDFYDASMSDTEDGVATRSGSKGGDHAPATVFTTSSGECGVACVCCIAVVNPMPAAAPH